MDPRLKKWLRWLKVAHDEIQQLLIAQDIFWSVQKLIKENPNIQISSSFYQYLGDTYVSYMLIGIRRQVKIDMQSISFIRLLREVAEDPGRVSREYFRKLYEGSVVYDFADRDFDRFCDSPGSRHVSSKMIRADVDSLREGVRDLEHFADRRVAHRDTRDPKSVPRFRDVDVVIQNLDKLYIKEALNKLS